MQLLAALSYLLLIRKEKKMHAESGPKAGDSHTAPRATCAFHALRINLHIYSNLTCNIFRASPSPKMLCGALSPSTFTKLQKIPLHSRSAFCISPSATLTLRAFHNSFFSSDHSLFSMQKFCSVPTSQKSLLLITFDSNGKE